MPKKKREEIDGWLCVVKTQFSALAGDVEISNVYWNALQKYEQKEITWADLNDAIADDLTP